MNDNDIKCKVGDYIIHKGKTMQVSEIIQQGVKARRESNGKTHRNIPEQRAAITACRIMDNGQVLTRSPIFIDQDWRKK